MDVIGTNIRARMHPQDGRVEMLMSDGRRTRLHAIDAREAIVTGRGRVTGPVYRAASVVPRKPEPPPLTPDQIVADGESVTESGPQVDVDKHTENLSATPPPPPRGLAAKPRG